MHSHNPLPPSFPPSFLPPFLSQLVGGDVLNLAGVITFTGTSWYEITMFGMESGAGLFVTNLAGVTLYTFNNFLEVNFAVVENAVGQGYLTAGGVTVCSLSAYMLLALNRITDSISFPLLPQFHL